MWLKSSLELRIEGEAVLIAVCGMLMGGVVHVEVGRVGEREVGRLRVGEGGVPCSEFVESLRVCIKGTWRGGEMRGAER